MKLLIDEDGFPILKDIATLAIKYDIVTHIYTDINHIVNTQTIKVLRKHLPMKGPKKHAEKIEESP